MAELNKICLKCESHSQRDIIFISHIGGIHLKTKSFLRNRKNKNKNKNTKFVFSVMYHIIITIGKLESFKYLPYSRLKIALSQY